MRRANCRELVVIANSLEARFRELSRVHRKGFNPPKQDRDRAEAEIFLEYENCKALRDYTRLHGLYLSEEVDRALTRYSIWLGLSLGPELEDTDEDLSPAGLQPGKVVSAGASTVAAESDLEGSMKSFGRKAVSKLLPMAAPLIDLLKGRPRSTEPTTRPQKVGPVRTLSFGALDGSNVPGDRGIFSPSFEKAKGRSDLLKRLEDQRQDLQQINGPQETIYFDATTSVPETQRVGGRNGGPVAAVGHLPKPQGAANPGPPPPSEVARKRNEVEVRAGAQGAIPKHPTLAVLDEPAPFLDVRPTLTEDALTRYFSPAAELSSVPGDSWADPYRQFGAIGGPPDLSHGSQPRPPSREGIPGPPQGPGSLNPNLPRVYPLLLRGLDRTSLPEPLPGRKRSWRGSLTCPRPLGMR